MWNDRADFLKFFSLKLALWPFALFLAANNSLADVKTLVTRTNVTYYAFSRAVTLIVQLDFFPVVSVVLYS